MTAEKNRWAAAHLPLVKIFIASSLAALALTLLFASTRIIIFMGLLLIPTLLYSIPNFRKPGKNLWLLTIPGLKSFLIALVWGAASVFLPVIQSGNHFNTPQILLLFAERLTFIIAIAIPFDIRDMKDDKRAGLRTIPIAFGEKAALTISNLALLFSLSIAIFHYADLNMIFVIPAYFSGVIVTFVIINSMRLQRLPDYYHGLLDGSIILYGIFITLSYYFKAYF